MQLNTILMIAAVAGPLVSWALTSAVAGIESKIAERKAAAEIAAAVEQSRQQCAAEKQQIETAKAAEIAATVSEAVGAANGVAPVPTAPAEITELCRRSSSCRERTQLPQR